MSTPTRAPTGTPFGTPVPPRVSATREAVRLVHAAFVTALEGFPDLDLRELSVYLADESMVVAEVRLVGGSAFRRTFLLAQLVTARYPDLFVHDEIVHDLHDLANNP